MSEPTHAQPVPRPNTHWRDRVVLMVVLAAGAALTQLASSSLQQAGELRTKERQISAAQAVVSVFNLELARTTEAVRSAGLMLESNPQLGREQFNRYMQKLVENQLSVNLMEWQPIVPASQLARFEAAAQAGGQSGYRVVQPDASGAGWEPVRGRDEYVPVLFAWPQSYRTEGFDMSFSPQRMASKRQSRALGQPVASGTFEFMKEGAVKSGSMAMAISTAVFGADQNARGYLAAVVDLTTLFQQATRLADASGLDLLVFDAATPEAAPIYALHGADSDLKARGTDLRLATIDDPSARVDFARQTWRLVLHPRPAFNAQGQENGARLAFAAGMGMTLLIALVLFRLQISRRNIERAESVANSALRALELERQQLEEAQRIAHVGSWHLNASGTQVWSDQMYHMLGLKPGAPPPLYAQAAKLFTPESWERLNTALAQTMESATPYELELQMIRTDGTHGWMLARGEAVRDSGGIVVAARGTATDVTERKHAADALRASELRFRSYFELPLVGIAITSLEKGWLDVNQRLCDIFAYPRDELMALSWTDITYPDDLAGDVAEFERVLSGQTDGYSLDKRFVRKDGLVVYASVAVRCVRKSDGSPDYFVALVQDIDARKQAEKALIESEERWKFAIDGAGDGLWDWNIQTGLAFYSPRYKAMYGYADADFGTTSAEWSSRIHPDDAPGVFAALQPFMDGRQGPASVEFRMLCKDGSWKWTLGRGMVVSRDADGKPLRMIGTNTDISERKQNEQILLQSLKDKQALLMEVHHRVKNNLQVISSLLRLETRRSTQADTKTVLTDMQGRIRSMAVLHESLYRSGTFASVDLGSYLRQLATQAFKAQQPKLDGTVRLALDVASVSVGMDQAIPCGLLVNELISNCLKHGFPQDRSGEVRVALQATAPENQQTTELWRLCVSDSGVGLPPDFDLARQTSLGLQLVGDLSRQIGGNLSIQSQPGAGAEFSVVFKALTPEALVMPL